MSVSSACPAYACLACSLQCTARLGHHCRRQCRTGQPLQIKCILSRGAPKGIMHDLRVTLRVEASQSQTRPFRMLVWSHTQCRTRQQGRMVAETRTCFPVAALFCPRVCGRLDPSLAAVVIDNQTINGNEYMLRNRSTQKMSSAVHSGAAGGRERLWQRTRQRCASRSS
jgi:hypothetical protein